MDNRALIRRALETPQGRAALQAIGATASSFLAGLTARAINNLVNNARTAGGNLFDQIVDYVHRDSVSSGAAGGDNAIQNNEVSSSSGPTAQKRPRIEETVEAPTEAVDSRMASMQGGQVAGGGAANQDSGEAYIARPISINRQTANLKFNKRFYFRLSTFLPKVYTTDPEVDNNYWILDPTYAFDFSSIIWYLNQTEMDEVFGIMSFAQVKVGNYSAQVKLVGQQSPFVTNVESQIPANPNMPTNIEVGTNIEASIPVALAEVNIKSGDGPKLSSIATFPRRDYGGQLVNKFMVPTFGTEPGDQGGSGQSITLPANMVERLYDITAAFPLLRGPNSLNWRYPQFNRFMTVYDGAKAYGTLLDCYEEPKECYLSVQRSVANDNTALSNVDIPTSITAKYYLGGSPQLTPIPNILDNKTQLLTTASGYLNSFRFQENNAYKLFWGDSKYNISNMPMHYIRVNTPYALDNSSPTELLLKICIETELNLNVEYDSGLWAQKDLMNFSLRRPMKLRPEMQNNYASFSANNFGQTSNYNDEGIL